MGDSQVAQGFGAGALGVAQVIGVIDDAAGIGVLVIDAQRVAMRSLEGRAGVTNIERLV